MVNNTSKSRYKYSKSEMEINRAFKMQEMELSNLKDKTTVLLQSSVNELQSDILKTTEDITDLDLKIQSLKESALDIAKASNISIPKHLKNDTNVSSSDYHINDSPSLSDKKVSTPSIPF